LSSTKFEAVLALTALDKKNNNVNKVWNDDWRSVQFVLRSQKKQIAW
jgi:hypothetical protein